MNVAQIGSSLSDFAKSRAKRVQSIFEDNISLPFLADHADGLNPVEAVFAKYDLAAISPREIDQMASDLAAAFFDDIEFLRVLMKRGEAALTKAQERFSAEGYSVSGFDPTGKLDLLQVSRDQLSLSRAFGGATQAQESFISKLERIVLRGAHFAKVRTQATQGSQLLVLSQAQRV
jgi:hypothetical protein